MLMNPRISRWIPAAAAALSLFAATLAADAQERRERGAILLGAFITDRATETRLDSDNGEGTDLDLESDLGFEGSTSVARLGGYFWVKPRGRLDVSIFDLSRDAQKRIDETIEFGDRTFNINTVITSENDLRIYKIDYTWAPINRERGYLGLIGGLYVADVGMSLSEPTLGTAESKDLTAPLPVIGLRGDYYLGDHFTLRGAMQWFGIDTGDVDGTLRDMYFGADYGFGKRMAVGLAYNKVSMGIRAQDAGGFQGLVDWGYDGYLLYFKYDFGMRPSR
jgi:hypothetical protein